MNTLLPYKIDIAILLMFFCRPEKFAKVFEQVKKAHLSKLYLYQDGACPRRDDDKMNVSRYREIASEIDWDCEAQTLYQGKNSDSDTSLHYAQKWMFEH